VRRCHWAVAFAGGYATYGDWSRGVSYFYMGFPGPGKAAVQLKHLRSFFELFPFRQMKPDSTIISEGFCLKKSPDICLIYLPEGKNSIIDLSHFSGKNLYMQWYDPRTGKWSDKQNLIKGKNPVTPPSLNDWALCVRSRIIK